MLETRLTFQISFNAQKTLQDRRSQQHLELHSSKTRNKTMNSIDTPFNLMGDIPLNKGICRSSIMTHSPSVERKIEIQGFYWPRLLLRNAKALPPRSSKGDNKKAHKIRHKTKKFTMKNTVPLSPSTSTSLTEILKDVPLLISDDLAHPTSPITGRPILSPRSNKRSILIPTKPVRKQLERRAQSGDGE